MKQNYWCENDVFKKLEPSVYQNSAAFLGNSKYEVTKSYGLFVCRKSLENVKSPGHNFYNELSHSLAGIYLFF